jgi:hypothetical protein
VTGDGAGADTTGATADFVVGAAAADFLMAALAAGLAVLGGAAVAAAAPLAAVAAFLIAAGVGATTTATSAVFLGRPRGFFTGSASATATDLRAVFTAAGASPLSRYGFGSSPGAPLRGVRGPRPGDGLRRSVMSSMCYVVSTHGSVRNHRRAECNRTAACTLSNKKDSTVSRSITTMRQRQVPP